MTVNQPLQPHSLERQFLVDVSAISRLDLKTGVQRVVRSVLMALLQSPPAGFRIEAVYLSNEGGPWHLRYARRYMLGLLGLPPDTAQDERAEVRRGDVYFCADLAGGHVLAAASEQLFDRLRDSGIAVAFVVHDLLPLQLPDKFPAHEIPAFRAWLDVVGRSDAVLCVSKTVAGHFSDDWRARHSPGSPMPFIAHFHHGADIEQSAPTRGYPENHLEIVSTMESRPSFLMVGTIEPRKGQAQMLATMEILWEAGVQWNLVLVGKKGWMVDSLLERIRTHRELGRRLFWMQGISDEFLQRLYKLSRCLVYASEGEGFGLPLIEAAQHGLPLVVRDLPVFREVAGDSAYYFSGLSPRALAAALEHWLQLYRHGLHPRSTSLRWQTWHEATEQIKDALRRSGVLDAPPGAT